MGRWWRIGLTLVAAAGAAGHSRRRSRMPRAGCWRQRPRGDAAQVAALAAARAPTRTRVTRGPPGPAARRRVRARAQAVRALLRGGARPDAADRSGWTALHQAVAATATSRAPARCSTRGDHPTCARGPAARRSTWRSADGRAELARLLRAHGARGSGKSIGDTVCVRPWAGDGYCGVVQAVDPTRARLRVTRARRLRGRLRGRRGLLGRPAGRAPGGSASATCCGSRPRASRTRGWR